MDTFEAPTRQPTTQEFLNSVLRLQPRVAAFDCDGTLWSSDAGETFFDWELREGLVSAEMARSMRARYAEYKAGRVSEDDMCAELVTMHRGLPESRLMEAATHFFDHVFPGKIFPEMQRLVSRLQQRSCEVWAVSSSNEWVIRAAMKHLGVPEEKILATKVELDDGIITDRVVRIPSGPGKPKALREIARKEIDAAFGNSRWDTEMLEMAARAFAVNPNPDLEAVARQHGWTVYFPDGTRSRS
jgi:HAD superfamily phosphoserine phosphatase-like hydrolase